MTEAARGAALTATERHGATQAITRRCGELERERAMLEAMRQGHELALATEAQVNRLGARTVGARSLLVRLPWAAVSGGWAPAPRTPHPEES